MTCLSNFFFFLGLAILLINSMGCGLKTPPLPPEEFAPEKITDLELYTKNKEIILKWSIPTRRVDGTKLLDLAGFEIYRKDLGKKEKTYYSLYNLPILNKPQVEYSLEEEWDTEGMVDDLDDPDLSREENDSLQVEREDNIKFIKIPVYPEEDDEGGELRGYHRIARISINRLEEVEFDGDYMIYTDEELANLPEQLTASQGFNYLIISFDRSNLPSRPSNIAQIWLSPSPDPPISFFALPGEDEVLLTWYIPPNQVVPIHSNKIKGFNVYRKGVQKEDFPFYPINDELIRENFYLDTEVTMGETYVYAIRSVTTDSPPWHEGPLSNEALVTLRDTYPPKPPQGLIGIAKENAIILNWNPNTEPDLLGYQVYRKAHSEANYYRITPSPLPKTTFKDQDIKAGEAYFYKITAVDKASPPNESPFSKEILVSPIKKE
jgi:hypothetical protein